MSRLLGNLSVGLRAWRPTLRPGCLTVPASIGSGRLRQSTVASPPSSKIRILPEGIDIGTISGPKSLSISARQRSFLPHLWLRDNCRCVHCVNQDTMQRNFNTFDIPKDVRPVNASWGESGLDVTWDHDGHHSVYPESFIYHYLFEDSRDDNSRWSDESGRQLWGASDHQKPPTVDYKEVMDEASEKGIATLTNLIRIHGFVFVANTPVSPADTQRLLERIAFIRVTHYGGFYDFIPDLAMADTAYTNLALPAHTDTTYFTDPAGLQAFHLLSHQSAPPSSSSTGNGNGPEEAAATGGQSLLVDGFRAAARLRESDPKAFEILRTVKLPWHASGNKGINIAPDKRYPVLEVDEATGKLHRVRWNNDDRGVVPFDSEFSPTEWYEAARKWDSILRDKDMEYWVQLTPGNTLIFDNWRVLHGRSAFQGVRRICGGYINRDDFVSRWRNTNLPPSRVLNEVIG